MVRPRAVLVRTFTVLITTMLAFGWSSIAAAQSATTANAIEFSPAPVPQQQLLDYLAGKSDLTLVDARSAEEYAAGHIYGAVSVPFDTEAATLAVLPENHASALLVYCKSGIRATKLQERLLAQGYSNVRVLAPAQMLWAGELPVFNCGATVEPTTQLTTVSPTANIGG